MASDRADVAVRLALAAFFAVAGVGHFAATDTFRAQVPPWMPAAEWVIWISGVAELAIALALAFASPRWRPLVGWLVAAFLVAVFPGNISQFVTGADAFGLDSDLARGIRLVFQPVLIVVVLWSTGAWSAWRGGAVFTGRDGSAT
jgi:uncharacterized membrane protein